MDIHSGKTTKSLCNNITEISCIGDESLGPHYKTDNRIHMGSTDAANGKDDQSKCGTNPDGIRVGEKDRE